MTTDNRKKLEQRVAEAGEAALAEQQYVTAIDVLIGVGWLTPQAVDRWRQGRVEDLERVAQANLHKLSDAMAIFRHWAADRGLRPREAVYVARTRDRRQLRFSRSGDTSIERAYRTHWVSPELSEAKEKKLLEKQSQPPDLVVISALKDWTCTICSSGGELLIMDEPGPLCLSCADLDHLVFLAAGDAALTRRAKKASGPSAVVVRFSRARGRYERQGLLVEEDALVQAEAGCLADEEVRKRQRLRDEVRREAQDLSFQTAFASEVIRLFRLPARARRRHRSSCRSKKQRPSRSDRGRTSPRSWGRHPGRGRVGTPPRHLLRQAVDVRSAPLRGAVKDPSQRGSSP
jgi:hypothetical protein